ncbi:MAG: hypothetical protein JNM62_13355 [Flavobacteriales bacterium]|nr:hypothetical protein [Flavobacteriales bacterium]
MDHVQARLRPTFYEANLITIDSALRKVYADADPRPTYFLRRIRCEQLYYQGLYDASLVEAEKARRIAERIGDSLLISSSLNQVAVLREEQGGDSAAMILLRQALDHFPSDARCIYPIANLYKIHGNMGLCWAGLGQKDSARWHLQRSITLARSYGSARGEALALFQMGQLGRDEDIAFLDSALDVVERNDIMDVALDIIPAKVEDLFKKGGYAEGLALLKRGEEMMKSRSDIAPRSIIRFHASSANILAEHGRSNEALKAFLRWHELDSVLRKKEARTAQDILRTKNATDAALEAERDTRMLTDAQVLAERRSRAIVLYGGGTGLLLLSGSIGLYLSRARRRDHITAMNLANAKNERQLAELRVRQQVSADLHDDLGAGLSALKLESELVAGTETRPEARERALHIATLASDLVASMRHILWTLEHNDASLEQLVTYTSDKARAFCAEHDISLELKVADDLPERKADAELRRNVWAVLRDALRALAPLQRGGRIHVRFNWDKGLVTTIHGDVPMSKSQQALLANQMLPLQARIAPDGGALRQTFNGGHMIRISLPDNSVAASAPSSSIRAMALPLALFCTANGSFAQAPLYHHPLLDSVMHNTSGTTNTAANIQVIDHALTRTKGDTDLVLVSQLLMSRANQFYYRGLYDRGIVDATEALRLAQKAQDSLLIATAYNMIGLLHENIHDDEAALPWFRTASRWLPLDTRSNYPLLKVHHVHGNLALCLFNLGRTDSAAHHYERSLIAARDAGNQRASALAHLGLARVALINGQNAKAQAHLDTADVHARRHGSMDVALSVLAERARGLSGTPNAQVRINRLLLAHHELIGDTTISPSSRRGFQRTLAGLFTVLGDEKNAVEAWHEWLELDHSIREQDDRATLMTLQAALNDDQRLQEERVANERLRLQLELDRGQRYLLAIIIASLVVLLSGLVIGIMARRRDMTIISELDLERSIADKEVNELRARQRISDEMHEDLGAGLTALKLRTEVALQAETDATKHDRLQRRALLCRELISTLHHIVWALDAGRSSLADSMAYVAGHARTYLAEHNIALTITMDADWPEWQLTMEQRRNLFLVVKEGLHNTVKHANATHVALSLRWEHGLQLILRDNGRGFDGTTGHFGGNGLRNMQKRIATLGGSFQMTRTQGTTIIVHLAEEMIRGDERSMNTSAA